jgi:hypothetical protein
MFAACSGRRGCDGQRCPGALAPACLFGFCSRYIAPSLEKIGQISGHLPNANGDLGEEGKIIIEMVKAPRREE